MLMKVSDFHVGINYNIHTCNCLLAGPSSVAELVHELREVVDWYHLGLHLKVPDHRLQIIEKDYPHDTEKCKTRMLSWWKENSAKQKWSTVVQALVNTGSRSLANKIALKFGRRLNKCPLLHFWSTLFLTSHLKHYVHWTFFFFPSCALKTSPQVFQFQGHLRKQKILLEQHDRPLRYVC